MLLLGDLLRLHVQSEAEKFLKPWWDVVIDYLNLVLVMVAVVCGVVSLSAPGPVCIPVLHCSAHNSSSHKTAMCAMIRNSSENGEDSLDITAAVPFSDRNMFDYINSECRENTYCLVRLFPNVLIVAAGCCVVCSAAWFALKSHVLEEFSHFLLQCYKHAGLENDVRETSDNNSTSTKSSVTIRCTFEEHSPSPTFTVSVEQREASVPPFASEEDRNRVGKRLENFIEGFDKNDIGQCRCSTSTESGVNNNTLAPQRESTPPENVPLVQTNASPQHDRNCLNFCSVKWSYIITSCFQTAVSIVTFALVLWLKNERMNRQYECNINERIPGLVYDHFACSYAIIQFYYFCALLFLVFTGPHMFFSCLKLLVSVVMLKRLSTANSASIKSANLLLAQSDVKY